MRRAQSRRVPVISSANIPIELATLVRFEHSLTERPSPGLSPARSPLCPSFLSRSPLVSLSRLSCFSIVFNPPFSMKCHEHRSPTSCLHLFLLSTFPRMHAPIYMPVTHEPRGPVSFPFSLANTPGAGDSGLFDSSIIALLFLFDDPIQALDLPSALSRSVLWLRSVDESPVIRN